MKEWMRMLGPVLEHGNTVKVEKSPLQLGCGRWQVARKLQIWSLSGASLNAGDRERTGHCFTHPHRPATLPEWRRQGLSR